MNSMVFLFILTGSSLYFSLIAAICGWKRLQALIERVLACVSGQNTTLKMIVIAMMAQP